MENNGQNSPYAGIYGGGQDNGDGGQQDPRQDARNRWQKIAQSKWLTIGIVVVLVVVSMARSASSKESVISMGIDSTSIGIVTPYVSTVFDIKDVDLWYRTNLSDWDMGEEIYCYEETANTIEGDYRTSDGQWDYLCMIYPQSPDILVIHYEGNRMVVFNGKNAEETNDWYNQLKDALGEPAPLERQD